jgi:Fe-S-cluster-containing dehydrogenase component
MIHEVLACKHCADHPCYEKCPQKEEAMKIDENGIVYVDDEFCIGCGLCAKACTYTPSRINMVKSSDKDMRKAKKCDLCRNRKEGPACIEWCPVRCIGLSDRPLPEFEPLPGPKGEPPAPVGDVTGGQS